MAISEDDRLMVRCFTLLGSCISFSGRSTTAREILNRAEAFEDYLVPADDEVMED